MAFIYFPNPAISKRKYVDRSSHRLHFPLTMYTPSTVRLSLFLLGCQHRVISLTDVPALGCLLFVPEYNLRWWRGGVGLASTRKGRALSGSRESRHSPQCAYGLETHTSHHTEFGPELPERILHARAAKSDFKCDAGAQCQYVRRLETPGQPSSYI
jgi:hypothetical protein